MCRAIRKAWRILKSLIEGGNVPDPMPNPSSYPPYLHGVPCPLCHDTGYTPCGVPPDFCGGITMCPQCQHNAGRIAQARLQISMVAAMIPDDQVMSRAEAWGIVVPS